MTLTKLFLAEVEREAVRTRSALEQVPTDRDAWAPHPKSMPLGRLAGLVASMFSWVGLIIDQDELDLTPPGGGTFQAPASNALVAAMDGHAAKAREVLARTTDEYLLTTNWKLRAGGHVVLDQPRHIVLRDTLSHLSHHRGQLTVPAAARLQGARSTALRPTTSSSRERRGCRQSPVGPLRIEASGTGSPASSFMRAVLSRERPARRHRRRQTAAGRILRRRTAGVLSAAVASGDAVPAAVWRALTKIRHGATTTIRRTGGSTGQARRRPRGRCRERTERFQSSSRATA